MAGLFSLDSFDVLTGTVFTGKPITIHRHGTTALVAEHAKFKVWKERAKGRHIAAEKAFVYIAPTTIGLSSSSRTTTKSETFFRSSFADGQLIRLDLPLIGQHISNASLDDDAGTLSE
ncbi:hypothetical protein MUO32_23720 [Shinella sp. CPCC 101442]|uniref:hypothetical protein n=1 Tax=Shinella sp. CPCC 101442 TaxID=2932265 RepID=UPI0021525882|nr:hypothetical protein [Shinella sp. CPCC 101442]MCR6502041.1 hypothetical protein [Shinella sp. CPCC 101442]